MLCLPPPSPQQWPCAIHKRARHSPGHRRRTSGLGNLSSFETHQWGEGGMAWESNGSCLEGAEGNRVRWRSTCRHVLKEQLKPSFAFTGGRGPARQDQSTSTIKQAFSEHIISSQQWKAAENGTEEERPWSQRVPCLSLSCWIARSSLYKESVSATLHLFSNPVSSATCEYFKYHRSSVKTPTP